MGSAVKAKCECGDAPEFLIGGGMATFETHCLFPCLCRVCKTIVSANLLQTPLACPECKSLAITPYDQEDLCQKKGEQEVTSWNLNGSDGRQLRLTNGTYYCPSCDSFRLVFEASGICWD